MKSIPQTYLNAQIKALAAEGLGVEDIKVRLKLGIYFEPLIRDIVIGRGK